MIRKKVIQGHHISYDPEWVESIYKGEHWIITQLMRRKKVSMGMIRALKVFKKYTKAISGFCDRIVITAGFPRIDHRESMLSLFGKNNHIIGRITYATGPGHYLCTNPVEALAERWGHIPVGSMLDEAREATDGKDGTYIIKRKGHTNWGVAAEMFRRIVDIKDDADEDEEGEE